MSITTNPKVRKMEKDIGPFYIDGPPSTNLRCMYGINGQTVSEVLAKSHVICEDVVYTIDE